MVILNVPRMDFLSGNSNGFDRDNVVKKCPFLRNISEPTNFSFSTTSTACPFPVHDRNIGPIFEDGSSFDTAFRLFHGQNGAIPLSGNSLFRRENSSLSEQLSLSPEFFNPFATTKAASATISISTFSPASPSKNRKKQIKKPNSSQGEESGHKAMGNEWLQHGNCPIAKSYRAVAKFFPLVAKALQLPPGIKIRCPPAIVAVRSALAKTAFAKKLRPQPLPTKMLVIGLLGIAVNVPLGVLREHTKKFSPTWFIVVHAAVPFIGMLRKCVKMPKSAMVLTIGASILGQVIGSRAARYCLH